MKNDEQTEQDEILWDSSTSVRWSTICEKASTYKHNFLSLISVPSTGTKYKIIILTFNNEDKQMEINIEP